MKRWQQIQEEYLTELHSINVRDYEKHLFWWNIFYPEDKPSSIKEPKLADYKRR
tara:strand:+ start:1026 stop:1187 length:162 start_codon:yes stop_codon:yes gene_type:complete